MSRAPTTVGGTADGTRRSTVGTLNMGTWAGTGEALAWDIASDVPSTSPSQGSNSGAHTGSHTVRIRTLLNVHVHMTRATSRTVPNPGSTRTTYASQPVMSWVVRTLRDMWDGFLFRGLQARCTGAPPVQLARSPLVNAVRQRVAANDSRAECLAGWCVSIRARPAKPRMSS